jgi:hypothetical protein
MGDRRTNSGENSNILDMKYETKLEVMAMIQKSPGHLPFLGYPFRY